jgi:hypothetical protein
MLEGLLLGIWVALVVAPLATCLHELAHALATLCVSTSTVTVRVGTESASPPSRSDDSTSRSTPGALDRQRSLGRPWHPPRTAALVSLAGQPPRSC